MKAEASRLKELKEGILELEGVHGKVWEGLGRQGNIPSSCVFSSLLLSSSWTDKQSTTILGPDIAGPWPASEEEEEKLAIDCVGMEYIHALHKVTTMHRSDTTMHLAFLVFQA